MIDFDKTHCTLCGGPVFFPGFLFCPWCGDDMSIVDIPTRSIGRVDTSNVVHPKYGFIEVHLPKPKREKKGPYDPASHECPACSAPLLTPAFTYCPGCGLHLLEDVVDSWDLLKHEKLVNLVDSSLLRQLLTDEPAMYRTLPES